MPARAGRRGRQRELQPERLPGPRAHHHVQGARGEGEGRRAARSPSARRAASRVPTSRPSARTRWTSRSSRVHPSAQARGPTAGQPRAPAPEHGVLAGEEELAGGREAHLHGGRSSGARRAGRRRRDGSAPPPARRHSRASRSTVGLVRGVGEEHRVGPGVQREPHRDALRRARPAALDERQRGRLQVAERRIGGERGGVHPPGVALGERSQRLQVPARRWRRWPGEPPPRRPSPRPGSTARSPPSGRIPSRDFTSFSSRLSDRHQQAQLRPVALGEACSAKLSAPSARSPRCQMQTPPCTLRHAEPLPCRARRETAAWASRGQPRRRPRRDRQRREAGRAAGQPRRRREVPARDHPHRPERPRRLAPHRARAAAAPGRARCPRPRSPLSSTSSAARAELDRGGHRQRRERDREARLVREDAAPRRASPSTSPGRCSGWATRGRLREALTARAARELAGEAANPPAPAASPPRARVLEQPDHRPAVAAGPGELGAQRAQHAQPVHHRRPAAARTAPAPRAARG